MKKVGVVGAGLMGSEIAYVIASSLDAKVVVRDVSEEALARGRNIIDKVATRAVQKGKATEQDKANMFGRMTFTMNFGDLADAEVVVEAVFENLDLKKQVFVELDNICTSAQILATNTSGLPITQIAAVTKNPQRVIGTHFFNPASVMRMVEVIRGYETSEDTLQKTLDFCHSVGKETVVSKDYPGFISTRLGQALIGEAIRVLEQGVGTVEDIDKACRLAFNHPIGPLELADLIGMDTELRIMESLTAEYGDFFRPSPLVKQMVAAGQLGRKTGRGFYDYSKR
ncbi:MAG: 3-hydroxyacyl-CoA dehydrogenase family protein [Chloroflexi bacterium]|nr:3-hydroxyacyl-CoA dehydrogenase family protein [Chloroflexota bacterium]